MAILPKLSTVPYFRCFVIQRLIPLEHLFKSRVQEYFGILAWISQNYLMFSKMSYNRSQNHFKWKFRRLYWLHICEIINRWFIIKTSRNMMEINFSTFTWHILLNLINHSQTIEHKFLSVNASAQSPPHPPP